MLPNDIHRLDQAIDEVSDSEETQCQLLREHLEAARASRLGEMTVEYGLNLRMARERSLASSMRRGVGA